MPTTQRVRDAMHIGVISCPSETPVAAALALISSYRIHAVVVTEGPGHLAGIFVTDRFVAGLARWRSL